MEDILDSGGRGETLNNVTSDGISVERDSRSRHSECLWFANKCEGNRTKSNGRNLLFIAAKEFRCARNIGFEDYFESDLFRSVNTGAPGMINILFAETRSARIKVRNG